MSSSKGIVFGSSGFAFTFNARGRTAAPSSPSSLTNQPTFSSSTATTSEASPFATFGTKTQNGFATLSESANASPFLLRSSDESSLQGFAKATSKFASIGATNKWTYDPTRPSPLEDLPAELRLKLYQALFEDAVIYVKAQSVPGSLSRRSHLSAILQTCRSCYDEARGPLYSAVSFIISRCWNMTPSPTTSSLAQSPFTPNASALLENLTFRMYDYSFMPSHEQLRTWFPKLKNLDLVLPEDLCRNIPFGFVADVTKVMELARPVDVGQEAFIAPKVRGSFLRWLQHSCQPCFAQTSFNLFRYMWMFHRQQVATSHGPIRSTSHSAMTYDNISYGDNRPQAYPQHNPIDNLKFQLHLTVDYRQCVLYFDQPPLREFLEHALTADKACRKREESDCNCKNCVPSHPVDCTFDAHLWEWTFHIKGDKISWQSEEAPGSDCSCCMFKVAELLNDGPPSKVNHYDLYAPGSWPLYKTLTQPAGYCTGSVYDRTHDGKSGIVNVKQQLADAMWW